MTRRDEGAFREEEQTRKMEGERSSKDRGVRPTPCTAGSGCAQPELQPQAPPRRVRLWNFTSREVPHRGPRPPQRLGVGVTSPFPAGAAAHRPRTAQGEVCTRPLGTKCP